MSFINDRRDHLKIYMLMHVTKEKTKKNIIMEGRIYYD